MGVELLAQVGERLLADVVLQGVYGQLEPRGGHHAGEVVAAVHEEQVQALERNGLVDDLFLHLQGQHPHGHGDHDDDKQDALEL